MCVTLWPNPGHEQELADYEDSVLALLPEHRSRLVARVRAADAEATSAVGEGHPYETQIIEIPDQAALDAYLADPRRVGSLDVRDRAIARTDIQLVTLV